jgi:hypothetical protein
MMSLLKYHLRRALSKGIFPSTFTLNSVHTCLTEIECILNSRPITFDSANPSEERPLAPINFLQPWRDFSPFPFPNPNTEADPTYTNLPPSDPSHLLALWGMLTKSSRSFWSKWRSDYLVSLRERHNKLTQPSQRSPMIGDLVLVADPVAPQSTWSPGLITSISPNSLGQPDTAIVRISDRTSLHRSVHHLFPLETEGEGADRGCRLPASDQAPDPKAVPTVSIESHSETDDENFIQLRGRRVLKH